MKRTVLVFGFISGGLMCIFMAGTMFFVKDIGPMNGARVVAKAWTDPDFRRRLLENGRNAVAELGLSLPAHH